jgi:hypothetical protein
VLLGVHAEDKNLDEPSTLQKETIYDSPESLLDGLSFNHSFIVNTAIAINATAYMEMYNNDIQSIQSVIDKIIKLGLLKDKLYTPEKIDGYIEVKGPKDWGRLDVSILRAANLVPKDANGLSDPYCKMGWCTKNKWETLKYIHQTKRKKENLNPEWTEKDDCNKKTYQFSESISKYQFLKVQIWDHDITSKDDFEGESNVPLSLILSNQTVPEIKLQLTGRSIDGEDESAVTGSVTISWKFKRRRRQLPKILKPNLGPLALKNAPDSKHSSLFKTSGSNEKSGEQDRKTVVN